MRKLIPVFALLLAASLAAQRGPVCKASTFGAACGPKLSARIQPHARFHVVTLAVAHGPHNGLGALVFGARTARIRLPGGKCALHVSPLVLVPFHTNDRGAASKTISVPHDVTGTALVQAVTVARGAHAVGSSNGVKIGCEKR